MESTPLLFFESVLWILPEDEFCNLALIQGNFGLCAEQAHAKAFNLHIYFDDPIAHEELIIILGPCFYAGHSNCRLPMLQWKDGYFPSRDDEAIDFAIANARDCKNVRIDSGDITISVNLKFLKYVKPIKTGKIDEIGIENFNFHAKALSETISESEDTVIKNMFTAAFALNQVLRIEINRMTRNVPNDFLETCCSEPKIDLSASENPEYIEHDNSEELEAWTEVIDNVWKRWMSQEDVGKKQFTLSGNPTQWTGVQWQRDLTPLRRLLDLKCIYFDLPERYYRFQHKVDTTKMAYLFLRIHENEEEEENVDVERSSGREHETLGDNEFMEKGNYYSLYLS
ncbi:hypothetical protein L596_022485 [Steinernema carpocapsae]|uniref:Uncharacterized protein n=1 Tax=Steinernema carpocapsae TaxID=34508 RepID=A0A4U5MLW5_STECR|nr:hypothetical protein L596_022485 [Steinernema carpocapsae]